MRYAWVWSESGHASSKEIDVYVIRPNPTKTLENGKYIEIHLKEHLFKVCSEGNLAEADW